MTTRGSEALLGLSVWCVLCGLYGVLAGSVSLHEALAGLGAVTATTALMLAVHRGRTRSLVLRPGRRALVDPLLSLPTDSVRVGIALARAILRRPAGMQGTIDRQPFRSGGEDPRDAGRRALVTLGSSLAPNGFVLHVPGEQSVLLLHRLSPAKPSPDQDWPA